jgi:hypothetical protein
MSNPPHSRAASALTSGRAPARRVLARSVLTVAAALALAGCPTTSKQPPILVDDAGCVAQCGKCAPLAACVAAPYRPACLQMCDQPSDCVRGTICAQIAPDLDGPSVCVSPSSLVWCNQQPCNIQKRCRDAQTLLTPLPYLDKICGWEVVLCDSGCDSTTAQCK